MTVFSRPDSAGNQDLPARFKQAVTPIWQWLGTTLSYWERPVAILSQYKPAYLMPDLMAGLTVAVVLLPQAIAYALIAELPPQMGLYAAIVAAIVGALWGSSIHLQSGPTNTASLLVLSALLPIAIPGTPRYLAAAGLLAVMAGVARLVMGLAHMGVLVNFVSDSVIIGFTGGAGILIGVNQVKSLLRLDFPSSPAFYTTFYQTIVHLPETHRLSLVLGLVTILVMIAIKRLRPRWPNALMAILVASVLAAVFGLERYGVHLLGSLPRSLPPLADLPLFDLDLIGELSTSALAIAAISLVEATSIARAISTQSGQRLDSNQEFIGQGLANIAAGLFSGYSTSGSFIRSSINYTVGGRTQLANVFSGLWVLVAMLIFAPLVGYLPRAALSGVLIVASFSMVNLAEMKRILHASRGDSIIMITTLLATLFLPLEFAVLSGIAISFARYILRTSMPAIYQVTPDESYRHFERRFGQQPCPQLNVVTIGGALYFGAVHHVEEFIYKNLEQYPDHHLLLLRMPLVDLCDVSGIHALEAITRLYRKRRGDVYLTGVRRGVMEQMRLIGFDQVLGEDHFLARDEAVTHLFHKVMDPSVCIYECPFRVFAECQALPKYPYSDLQQSQLLATEKVILPEEQVRHLLPSELKALLEDAEHPTLHLLDVREASEFSNGHIPQARLLPLRVIPQEGRDLRADREIILVCRTGRRSRLAAYILQEMGYTEIYNLTGGMLAWEAAGYPVAVE